MIFQLPFIGLRFDMTNPSPIRFAIVGSGAIAKVHAAAITLIPDTRLAAVCSRNRDSAEVLAAPCGARVFDSPSELAEWDGVDAVLVATPSGVHQDAVLPALRSGKPVLCEKPLEISVERVRLLIAEAERTKTILAGFFPLRSGAGAEIIQSAIAAGRFGRLTFLSARVKWWRNLEYYGESSWKGTHALDGGGALINQGIHAVDLLQWIGGRPREIMAFASTLAHPGLEMEDTIAAALRFENGALGTIEAATSCHPGLDLSLEVSGDCGTAILVNDRIGYWRFREELPGDEAVRNGESGGEIRGGASDPGAITCEGHRRQIVEFCRAIRGESANVISAREAGISVAIVEAAYRSAVSKKSELIDYP